MRKQKLLLFVLCAALLVAAMVLSMTACRKSDKNNDHICSFSDWFTVTEPTCESDGLEARECSCGARITESLSAIGHNFAYDKGTFITDTSVPVYRYSCARTGCTKTESAEANMNVTEKDPTCTEDGVIKHTYYIFVNGEYYESTEEEAVEALGHDFGVTSGEWIWNGYGSASYKVVCQNDRSHTEVYTAVMSEVTEEATCTLNGRVIHTATVRIGEATVSDSKNETLNRINHNYDYDNGVWEWDGYESATYVVSCINDPTHKETKSANVKKNVVAVPDCEKAGLANYTVSVYINGKTYSDTKTETSLVLGHDYDVDTAQWEWMDNGTYATVTFTCKRGTPHSAVYVAEVEYEITVAPTCFESGMAHAKATACLDGVTFTDERDFDVEPCDHSLDWPNAYWDWDGNTGATFIAPCKLGEPHNLEIYTEASKTVEDPDCYTDGYESYIVSVEISGLTPVDEKRIVIPATGHDYEISSVTWSYDDVVWANIDLICKNDNRHTHSDVNFATDETVVDPTCTKAGSLIYTVTVEVDGKEYSASVPGVAEKAGHLFGGAACYKCGVPVYSNGLEFELNDDESGYILKGAGSFGGGVLSIPDSYNGLPVVEIADNAFYKNTTIRDVYISENITKVGNYAFMYCTKIENVVFALTDGALEIGNKAFAECESLRTIDIPGHVTKLKTGAFSYCISLESARVGAQVIYSGVFAECRSLRSVELLEGIVNIDNFLSDIVPVYSLTIPSTVTTFNNNILNNVRLLEIKNLSKCKIETVYTFKNIYTATEGESRLWTDQDTGYVFYVNGDNRYLMGHSGEGDPTVLPKSCDGQSYVIYQYALSNVDFGYEPLFIPDAVTTISNYAAYGNTTIKILSGGKNVEAIGNYAFYNCTELLSVTLGAGLKNISQYSFDHNNRVCELINHSSINVQGNLKRFPYAICEITDKNVTESAIFFMDDFAFYSRGEDCYLVSYFGKGDDDVAGQLTLPVSFFGLEYGVYKKAIRDIDGVSKIKLGAGVNQICSEAFIGDFDEIVTSGSSLKRIEDKAFESTKITYIYLPSSLEYIGKYAFPETLEKAKFADTADWKIETVGMASVNPDKITDEEDAAKYLLDHDYTFFEKIEDEE